MLFKVIYLRIFWIISSLFIAIVKIMVSVVFFLIKIHNKIFYDLQLICKKETLDMK